MAAEYSTRSGLMEVENEEATADKAEKCSEEEEDQSSEEQTA